MVMPYDLKEEVWLIWSQGSGIILADYRGNDRKDGTS